MIRLRNMREDEYPGFLEYFIEDYGNEIQANYLKSAADARLVAQRELRDDLPDGVRTADNVLLCIEMEAEAGRTHVGYLWYKENKTESSVFILDFYIKPPYRKRGYGRSSLRLLQETLRSQGFNQLKLRVAATNAKAIALYEELEFFVTGINMAKNLSSS